MRLASLRSINRHNISILRSQPLAEISGALGDLGTFLPIVIALTIAHQISLPTTLIFTGIFNILTGCFFGIPLPVQPMKAIAAVALLRSFSAGQVQAAGLFVAGCILVFSITGLLAWFTRTIPVPVVKGIQVGAGLSLMLSAGNKATEKLAWFGPCWEDNYWWGLLAFFTLLVVAQKRTVPYALIVFVLGLALAAANLSRTGGGDDHKVHFPTFRLWQPYTQIASKVDWQVGVIDAGIGQLPLTTLNSIIAVVHLSADLLPEVPTPSVSSIGISVAAMNLFGCWFGGMPVCHGSGGLAAQHRFGARSGASIVILGIFKLVVGLLLGESLVSLLDRFPTALLTVMVIAAGMELAQVGQSLNTSKARDVETELDEAERHRRWTIMLMTVGMLLAFKNVGLGFLAGMLCHWATSFVGTSREYEQRHSRRRLDDSTSHETDHLLP